MTPKQQAWAFLDSVSTRVNIDIERMTRKSYPNSTHMIRVGNVSGLNYDAITYLVNLINDHFGYETLLNSGNLAILIMIDHEGKVK